MVEVLRTGEFDRWLFRLKDKNARLRIAERIDRLAGGNPGDVKSLGQGVFELRLAFGPGYRIYYVRRGEYVLVLLCGGDKSTQQRDIDRAYRLADQTRRRER